MNPKFAFMECALLLRSVRARLPLCVPAALLCAALSLPCSTGLPPEQNAPTDKDICRRKLGLIHDAIQSYRIAHKDLPNLLSDLLPIYLADAEVLYCPESRKRGRTSVDETGRTEFAEPNTSYFYEFRSVPLEEIPGRTNRDWKRAQMGLLGSDVPIVRCLMHDRRISLTFGGKTFETEQLEWEYRFTNVVDIARLAAENLLAPTGTVRVIQVPPREPAATPRQLDITEFFNASLAKPWISREPDQHLATLPMGLQKIGDVLFDVRGVIQLSSRGLYQLGERFPERVGPIAVNQPAGKLHFLIGASLEGEDGAVAGGFEIQYQDGKIEKLELVMGTHLRSTWNSSGQPAPAQATVAWRGAPPNNAQLYNLSWPNPIPGAAIRSIDCFGGTNTLDFFLVALSVTP